MGWRLWRLGDTHSFCNCLYHVTWIWSQQYFVRNPRTSEKTMTSPVVTGKVYTLPPPVGKLSVPFFSERSIERLPKRVHVSVTPTHAWFALTNTVEGSIFISETFHKSQKKTIRWELVFVMISFHCSVIRTTASSYTEEHLAWNFQNVLAQS